MKFQSLLYWITVVDQSPGVFLPPEKLVSILVVVDHGRRLDLDLTAATVALRFQSLL